MATGRTVDVTTDGDTLWLECCPTDGTDGHLICPIEPGDSWETLASKVAAHSCNQPGHGPGAPRHGYDGTCDDYCDNSACPRGLNHEVCTDECDGRQA